MLLDLDRVLSVCDLADELLDAAKRGDRAWLSVTCDELQVHDVSINHNYYIPTYRAAFLRKHPGAEGPLAAFDEVLGRITRNWADHWLDPENLDELVELAAKAAELRAALEGKPTVTPPVPPSRRELVEQAAALLVDSPEGVKLLHYLDEQPEGRASLDQIARDLDKAATPALQLGMRERIRRRHYRTRQALEKLGSPVSLDIDNNIISIIVIDRS